MKKWNKIVIILTTVVVLFVSVFAVSSYALDTTNLKFGLPSVNYVYYSDGYAMYASAPSLMPNTEGGNGSFGYFGNKNSSVRYGWRRFSSDTFYEYYQCASTSEKRYGISIDMAYLKLAGRNNSAFDVGLSFSISSDVGSADDSFTPTGQLIDSGYSARVRVYGLDGYFFDSGAVQNGTYISATQTFVDTSVDIGSSVYLSSILSQYYDYAPYISRIDIDVPYVEGYFTTFYFNLYTGGVDYSHLGNHYMPMNDSSILHMTEVDAFNRGIESGKSMGYSDGYNAGYDAGVDEGYEYGYEQGTANNQLVNNGMFSWIFDGIQGFMQFELFPNFSIGLVLSVICGASLFIWLLKLFAGG